MGLNFPNAPTVGQTYPSPAIAGLPVWKWDGTVWGTSPNNVASAANVAFAPAGNIAATNTQSAVQEVDAEKVAKAGDTMTGPLVISGADYQASLKLTNTQRNRNMVLRMGSGATPNLEVINNANTAAILSLDDTGLLAVARDVTAGFGGTVGTYYFGNSGTKYLQYDGTQFALTGGPLTVNGNINCASGAFKFAGINLAEIGGGYTHIYNGSGDYVCLHIGGSVDRSTYYRNTNHNFQNLDGSVAFGTFNSGGFSVTGVITASGNITAANFITQGNILANSGVYLENGYNVRVYWDGSRVRSTYGLYVAGDALIQNDMYVRYSSANTGTLYFGSNAANYLSFDGANWAHGPSGASLYTNGPVRPTEVITTTMNGLTTTGSGWTGAAYLTSLATGNPNWGTVTWQAVHFPGAWAGARIDAGGSQFDFRNGGEAYKNGGSIYWNTTSDARIKDVKAPYQHGLDAIAALNPVIYSFKDNYSTEPPPKEPREAPTPNYGTGAEYVGLIAQEAEGSMPELFKQSKGWIDGVEVDDLRSAEYTPLIFALVNAVKTLKARVEALEARP